MFLFKYAIMHNSQNIRSWIITIPTYQEIQCSSNWVMQENRILWTEQTILVKPCLCIYFEL